MAELPLICRKVVTCKRHGLWMVENTLVPSVEVFELVQRGFFIVQSLTSLLQPKEVSIWVAHSLEYGTLRQSPTTQSLDKGRD